MEGNTVASGKNAVFLLYQRRVNRNLIAFLTHSSLEEALQAHLPSNVGLYQVSGHSFQMPMACGKSCSQNVGINMVAFIPGFPDVHTIVR